MSMSIKFMSEQTYNPLPISDNIIVKLPRGTEVYYSSTNTKVINATSSLIHISTKEFADRVAGPTLEHIQPAELFQQGIQVEILEPEKKWVSGKVRLNLVFEFIPDEPEILETPIKSRSQSSLDDIRKAMNGNI